MTKNKEERIRALIHKYDEDIKSLRLKGKYNVITTLEFLIEEEELDNQCDKNFKEINNDKE